MITRGIIIGKIIDDFANLKYQIELRNKLGQFDLSKICEDFSKEFLNIIYNHNLQNLNQTRLNVPGIDLGDERKRIAYQVTSQKTSSKINKTLSAITQEQKMKYDTINVFILGQKQTSYKKIDKNLSKEYGFKVDKHIVDIDDVLRDIVLLDIEQLDDLYRLFQREFRQVRIELEPIDSNGNFESSYYNSVEKKPASPPKNGSRFLEKSDKHYKKDLIELINVYERLASIPRVTREILAIIVDKGRYDSSYEIMPEALQRFMRIDEKELLVEINILEDAGLVGITENTIGEREVGFIAISGEMLNSLFIWMQEEKLSIRTILNTMDFSIIDE